MPYVLWVKGATSLLAGSLQDRFTITGARASTSYGAHVAQMLANDLASEEKVLVSGGAYGIDAAVHTAALASGGHTVAVLAGGLDRPHPAGHRELLERIGDLGLLVSELPPGAVPTRTRFLARARIEAALSGSTTIVEAAGRSGALPVAQCAHELGRAVGAVPGPVTSTASMGTHRTPAGGRRFPGDRCL
jgi:DNA processing protein